MIRYTFGDFEELSFWNINYHYTFISFNINFSFFIMFELDSENIEWCWLNLLCINNRNVSVYPLVTETF